MNSFRENHPVAWEFHKNSSRSIFQLYDPDSRGNLNSPYKEYPDVPAIKLPSFKSPNTELTDLISERQSCRHFKEGAPLSFEQISSLLHYGIAQKGISILENQELIQRRHPSAGGLYPIEIYIICRQIESIPSGIYHYCITPFLLEEIKLIEIPDSYLINVFMNQYYIANAGAIIVATSVMNRTMWKYGDRGYRYILLEAGHLFQNLNLICTALGIGCLNMGGFFDEDLSRLLGLDPDQELPVYAMAVGVKGS